MVAPCDFGAHRKGLLINESSDVVGMGCDVAARYRQRKLIEGA